MISKVALAALAASLVSAAPVQKRQGGPKRGLLYNDASLTDLFNNQVVGWAYNWASTPTGSQGSTGQLLGGIEYVPMLFDGTDANWDANVNSAAQSGSTHLLAMNEPDQSRDVGGTAIDAGQAAQIYQQKMNPHGDKFKLGAPAVSAGGIGWLQNFANACAGNCKIDFVPLHFYDYGHPDMATQETSLEGFLTSTIPQVRQMFNNPNLPIWVTEFAYTPFTDAATSASYMDKALPFMENNGDIERYSYFYVADGQLTSGGQLNQAGQRYNQ